MTEPNPVGSEYFWGDHESRDELARLKLIEHFNDPSTFRHLDRVGVSRGWRCLEVGAGAGSVTRWLSERVGDAGEVVAADLDVRFLSEIDAPNVEVRRCDVTTDPLEASKYDLVHARSVLTHLHDPQEVLRRMRAAVRPGGWLVVEDVDNGTVEAADPGHRFSAAFDTCAQARIEFLRAGHIMDLRYGRILPRHMHELDLLDMGNEAVAIVGCGRTSMSQLMIQSFEPVDEGMVTNGFVERSMAREARQAFEDPTFLYRGGLIVCAWGRTPSDVDA